MFDVLAKFDKDSLEYKTVMERIMCGQNYQQNAIDKIKGIVSKSMPKEWYNYKYAKDNEFSKSIVANKKPYFFIYIYPHRKKEYDRYIEQTSSNCLMRFGMTVEELIELENRTDKQAKFLKYYFERMPVSLSKSVMNKICWKIEQEFDNYKLNYNNEFDYSILKTDSTYSKGRFNAIKKLYRNYIDEIQQYIQIANQKRIDNEERKANKQILKEKFKKKAYEICNNAEELCNIVIDITYKNNNSKQFAWDVCGDTIIENLLRNNNYKISYPVMKNDGDIEFGGNRFIMKQEVVDEDNIR